MTLFELIKDWKIVEINKINKGSNYLSTAEQIKEKLPDSIKDSVIFIDFAASNGPLFGRGFVLAINDKCEIVESICTWIS